MTMAGVGRIFYRTNHEGAMRYDFHDRFTNKVIHTENIPDDCSRPVRIALEQAVIRGRPADELRRFRSDAPAGELRRDLAELVGRKCSIGDTK
jgi:hypothetical protein